MGMITHQQLVNYFRGILDDQSQRTLSRELGMSQTYVSDILTGKRRISNKMANKLGYRRVDMFESINEDTDGYT